MPQELIQLSSRRLTTRIFLGLLILSVTVLSVYAVRWYVGNTLAEYFEPDESSLDLARTAVALAPNDPLTHWTVGDLLLKRMPLDQLSACIPEYQKAISLSPNDYRYWMSLGMAQQRMEETDKAEQTFRHAIQLAPSYVYPHWYLGNLLLRAARYDEAFDELRKASDGDSENMRPQFFNLIWQVYDDDLPATMKALGDSSGYRGEFARFQVMNGRYDQGLKIWDTLSAAEKKNSPSIGDLMIKDLINGQQFHSAAKVWNEVAGHRIEEGQFTDGSFESVTSRGFEGVFDWQVKNEPGVQIGIDAGVSHSGSRSLRLSFQVQANTRTMSATQLVSVAKDSTYDFECYVRTEKLNSGGTPAIQILDATTNAVLVSSEAAPNGDNDWGRIALAFKTSDKTEAILMKIIRSSCGEDDTVCPIFGSVWYDDFSLNRRK